MTDEIGNFEAKNLWERGAALVGDKAERMNTVKFLVGSWTNSDGALIICDGDGSLYSQYGGGGLLVDFLSANSVVPDVCTPIVRHRRYGRSSRESARLIGDIVVRERFMTQPRQVQKTRRTNHLLVKRQPVATRSAVTREQEVGQALRQQGQTMRNPLPHGAYA